MATIARSVRPLFFRTDCMLGSLHMETRRIRAQVKGWSDALRGCNGRPEEVPSIRPSFCDSRLFYHGHGARCPDIRGGLPVKTGQDARDCGAARSEEHTSELQSLMRI